MDHLKRLEDFIVNTDDVFSLMELYATRIKAYPDNRAYYHALALQCGEFLLAAQQLGAGLVGVSEAAHDLHQLSKLLDEKGLAATNRQMEVFIEEIQDLALNLKRHYATQQELPPGEPAPAFRFASQNSALLKNFIRKLAQEKAMAPAPPSATGAAAAIVDDPFDEMEGFGDFVDSLLDDLDDAFDAITQPRPSQAVAVQPDEGRVALSSSEEGEIQKLFLSISSAYLQPVKEFVAELQSGAASKQWVDICISSLKIIEDAGTKMSYEKINRILDRFKKLMMDAKYSESTSISRDIRIQLLKEYANLTTLLPEAFATSGSHATRGSVRDTIIINTILRKTPGIGPVSRNKLIAAGMNSLDKYFMATSKDLAAVSGITDGQARAICEAFGQYRQSVSDGEDAATRIQGALTRLFKHVKELKAEHEAYKDLTRRVLRAPELEGDRDDIRVQRQRTMWEINIILAELDAIRLVEDFRKMVFDRRIQRLDEFLQSEARKYF
ncbi:MAG TPA: hypothetical protein PK176_02915 [Acidobacteriota bacterium]|nr:hypothetical protein [Acidobacteriota bacterium]HQM62240.1 hypothetical protein [Acidobacteriota bacterium]